MKPKEKKEQKNQIKKLYLRLRDYGDTDIDSVKQLVNEAGDETFVYSEKEEAIKDIDNDYTEYVVEVNIVKIETNNPIRNPQLVEIKLK